MAAVIKNDSSIFIDVDDTLVMWEDDFYQPATGRIAIKDPYDNKTLYLRPHKFHAKILRDHKARGFVVVVWSAAGYQWAESVVSALNLSDSVDLIMSKPTKYMDDLHANEILGSRIYLKDKEF